MKGDVVIPLSPPVVDKTGEQGTILECPTCVTFSLVPDNSFDFVRNQGMDHCIVKHSGRMSRGLRSWGTR